MAPKAKPPEEVVLSKLPRWGGVRKYARLLLDTPESCLPEEFRPARDALLGAVEVERQRQVAEVPA